LLMPTDAALGQAVVSSDLVPIRIRQTLNVESGLNDGLALPAVLILSTLASVQTGSNETHNWTSFVIKALVFGPLVGAAIGYGAARLVLLAREKEWMNHSFQQLSGVAVAIVAYAAAESIHGNGFISAFVSGLAFGNTAKTACECIFEFAEAEGQLLALLAFLLFGVALVLPAFEFVTPTILVYLVLSLTLVRMIPVAISLLGLKFRLPTIVFLGWFGPRGLATILFAILIMDEAQFPHVELVQALAMMGVLFSVFLHGVSAIPFVRRFHRYIDRNQKLDPHMPELNDAPSLRLRLPPVLVRELKNQKD